MKDDVRGEWFDDFLSGLTAYYLTSLPVLLGVLFGTDFLYPANGHFTPRANLIHACVRFDAAHYLRIMREGYSYDPTRQSPLAFFPAYPLLSRCVSMSTGLPLEATALLSANAALLGAFVMLARWSRVRWPEATAAERGLVLTVFGLWPLGAFFRMPYAESLFLFVTLTVLYGMARGWPLLTLALLTGFVTAIRPVGVAMTAAFSWHLLTQPCRRPRVKAGLVLLLATLACWGLLAYMGYQWMIFGNPLAFAQTQEHWSMLAPTDSGWLAKLRSLATLEPVWGAYVPGYQRYWANASGLGSLPFSLFFWNPILFVLAAVLLAWGRWKRWLGGSELILGVSLLAIPYVTRSYEMSMASHGRFAAVVVVNYLVIGRILSRFSSLIAGAVCAPLALVIFIFTSLYVTNYRIF